jgi:tetrapyrrole methylase family protein / MazG family protein
MQPDPVRRLVEILATLRAPDGCPWDREQTHESLRAALLEEAHEVIAAIDARDVPNLREELGDLLLHVVFHAQMAGERGDFNFDDVAAEACAKMIRRHPHIFGRDEQRIDGTSAVLAQWETIKRREKGADTGSESALQNLPASLPTLIRAQKAQAQAARVGFDWPGDGIAQLLEKLSEETGELKEAVAAGRRGAIEDELGDLFFTLVNLARRLGVDSELAAARATDKFIRRFRAAEAMLAERGVEAANASLEIWDECWETAKRSEMEKSKP